MLGAQTQGSRMKGTDEPTVLWWHPLFHDFSPFKTHANKKNSL